MLKTQTTISARGFTEKNFRKHARKYLPKLYKICVESKVRFFAGRSTSLSKSLYRHYNLWGPTRCFLSVFSFVRFPLRFLCAPRLTDRLPRCFFRSFCQSRHGKLLYSCRSYVFSTSCTLAVETTLFRVQISNETKGTIRPVRFCYNCLLRALLPHGFTGPRVALENFYFFLELPIVSQYRSAVL